MKTLKGILLAESTEYEFKSELELKKPKSRLKTVSAFANGLGGSIYFGVDDGNRTAYCRFGSESVQASSYILNKMAQDRRTSNDIMVFQSLNYLYYNTSITCI
jgi:ATP-dependent DNA helicase RecG